MSIWKAKSQIRMRTRSQSNSALHDDRIFRPLVEPILCFHGGLTRATVRWRILQVQELCLHRAPALLDEMVALLISEFQVWPDFHPLLSSHLCMALVTAFHRGLEALGPGFQQARI